VGRTITVAVISDDRLVCDGVLRLLRDVEDCTAIGFSDEDGSLAPILRDQFQVAILDARADGVLATCRVLAETESLSVILIGASGDEPWAIEALCAGARGILTTHARSEDLVRAIRAVEAGDAWVRRQWLCSWLRRNTRDGAGESALAAVRARFDGQLSRREREVFHHAATGVSNREIAHRLAISEATVKVHLTRIFRKLGLSGRGELVAAYYGVTNGQVPELATSQVS